MSALHAHSGGGGGISGISGLGPLHGGVSANISHLGGIIGGVVNVAGPLLEGTEFSKVFDDDDDGGGDSSGVEEGEGCVGQQQQSQR